MKLDEAQKIAVDAVSQTNREWRHRKHSDLPLDPALQDWTGPTVREILVMLAALGVIKFDEVVPDGAMTSNEALRSAMVCAMQALPGSTMFCHADIPLLSDTLRAHLERLGYAIVHRTVVKMP